jgi:aminoglycoside phosphotransferase (APT) family kinase protein
VALRPDAPPPALAGWLIGTLKAEQIQITAWRKLSGGAIQENWAFTARIRGGNHAGTLEAVLRTDAPTGVAVSLGRAEEFAILSAAHEAGVRVPEPLGLCADGAVLGKPFYVMRRVDGTALGHVLANDAKWTGDRVALAETLGGELAKIHTVRPPRADLAFLAVPEGRPAFAAIAGYRAWLDGYRMARPALELGLRWLELNAPARGAVVLCHRDYRTGNYMADEAGLTGILDWEFAGWGDPDEDIGWFCAKCWRFGQVAREAGGIGARADFLRGYSKVAGRTVDPAAIRYWEIMAHARWAVIALQQGERFVGGGELSLDLALTGRRIAELEYELLASIDPVCAPGPLPSGLPVDRPDAGELAALAAQVFGREMLPALGDDRRLQGLMLASALGTVARGVAATEEAPDRSLVGAIRTGRHDRDAGLHGALREDARARTRIANPKYPF